MIQFKIDTWLEKLIIFTDFGMYRVIKRGYVKWNVGSYPGTAFSDPATILTHKNPFFRKIIKEYFELDENTFISQLEAQCLILDPLNSK